MKIARIGASGNAGSRIAAELSWRGHDVTAIARNAARIDGLPGLTPLAVDSADTAALVSALEGHDAVVSSVHFTASDADNLIGAVKASGVKRYLVVGGAGSLEVAPGVKLVDTPQFPPEYKEEATKGAALLDKLRGEKDLDWTYLSPSAVFMPGERTGQFRLGGDALLTNEAGSSISFADYAIALVDEIDTPRHARRRFTIGY